MLNKIMKPLIVEDARQLRSNQTSGDPSIDGECLDSYDYRVFNNPSGHEPASPAQFSSVFIELAAMWAKKKASNNRPDVTPIPPQD